MSEENPFKIKTEEAQAAISREEKIEPIAARLVNPETPHAPKATGEQCKDILELVAELEGKVLGLRSNVESVESRNNYLEEHHGIAPTTHLALGKAIADAATKTAARRCAEIMMQHGAPAGDPVFAAIRKEFGL